MTIADVAFDAPVHHSFSYRVPDGWTVVPGQRAQAPLGGAARVGMVVAVRDGAEPGLKPLAQLVDAEPVLSRAQLDLVDWIAARTAAAARDARATRRARSGPQAARGSPHALARCRARAPRPRAAGAPAHGGDAEPRSVVARRVRADRHAVPRAGPVAGGERRRHARHPPARAAHPAAR